MADRVSDNLAMLMRVVDRLSPLEDFCRGQNRLPCPEPEKANPGPYQLEAGSAAPGWPQSSAWLGLGDESKEGGLQPGLPADDTRVPGGARLCVRPGCRRGCSLCSVLARSVTTQRWTPSSPPASQSSPANGVGNPVFPACELRADEQAENGCRGAVGRPIFVGVLRRSFRYGERRRRT